MSNDNQPTGQQLTPEERAQNYQDTRASDPNYCLGFADRDGWLAGYNYAAQQTATLRGQLEDRNDWENTALLTQAELEAVKKERDELAIRARSTTNALIHIAGAPFVGVDSIKSFAKNFLSDIANEISSGETKPASPWVSVEDRLPVVGDRYNFINDITHSSFYGEVFGGKYMGCRFGHHEFTLPGHSMTAKYYCPIPALPESLTDKK